MIEQKTWSDFRDTGLLLIINQILHVFGYAIVLNVDDGKVVSAYPARVKFRGFGEKQVEKAYVDVSEYMKKESETLLDEAKQ